MRLASFGTTASYVNRPCPGASPPPAAAEEAAYVAHAVGANLLAFQIGNEPDGFGRWTAVRPKTYDFTAYLTEWDSFRAAVQARVPEARFAGPDVASDTAWVGALAEKAPDGLVLLTRHCYADGPAGAGVAWEAVERGSANRAPSTASTAEMLIASRRCPLSTP